MKNTKQHDVNILTLRQRQACTLAWADRMPHRGIAAVFGVSLSAVRKRVQRAVGAWRLLESSRREIVGQPARKPRIHWP